MICTNSLEMHKTALYVSTITALKEQAQYDHSQSASKLALQRRQKAITNQKNQAEHQKYKIVISTFIFL